MEPPGWISGVNLPGNLQSPLCRHPADLSAVLCRAREAGVERLLVTGGSLEESRAAIQLAREHPDQVRQEQLAQNQGGQWSKKYL